MEKGYRAPGYPEMKLCLKPPTWTMHEWCWLPSQHCAVAEHECLSCLRRGCWPPTLSCDACFRLPYGRLADVPKLSRRSCKTVPPRCFQHVLHIAYLKVEKCKRAPPDMLKGRVEVTKVTRRSDKVTTRRHAKTDSLKCQTCPPKCQKRLADMTQVTSRFGLIHVGVSKRFANMAKPPPRNTISEQFLPSRGAFCHVGARGRAALPTWQGCTMMDAKPHVQGSSRTKLPGDHETLLNANACAEVKEACSVSCSTRIARGRFEGGGCRHCHIDSINFRVECAVGPHDRSVVVLEPEVENNDRRSTGFPLLSSSRPEDITCICCRARSYSSRQSSLCHLKKVVINSHLSKSPWDGWPG